MTTRRKRGGSALKSQIPPEFLRALARREAHVAEARNNVNAFVEYVFTTPEGKQARQGQIHREWQDLADVYQRLVVIAPRGHWKTGQFAIARPLFVLGQSPDELVKIVCQSDRKAVKRLSEIREHLKNNDSLHRVFPHLKVTGRESDLEWNKHLVTVHRTRRSPDPSIEALGVTSSASGDRATYIVFDDVVDRRNAITLPRVRESIKHSFDDWINLLLPGGRVLYIATLWHHADLTHALLKNPEYSVAWYEINPDTLGSFVRLPDGTERRSDFALWGEADGGPWTREELRRRKRELGSRRFARGFSNRPTADDELRVKPEWIRFWRGAPPDHWDTVLAFDFASSQSPTADWTGVVELAVNPDAPDVSVVNAFRDKLTFPEKLALVKTLVKNKRPRWVVVELAGGGREVAEQLIRTTRLGRLVRGVKPRGSKGERLDRVTPLIERGIVTFNPELDPLRLNAKNAAEERGSVIDELTGFPIAESDDLLDALVHGLRFVSVVYDSLDESPEDENDDPDLDERERNVEESSSVLLF